MGAPSITLSPGGGFLLEPTGSVTIFTPEMLSDEQRMMKETADDFMMKEVMPRVADIEAKKPGVMRDLLQKAGGVGLLRTEIPFTHTSTWPSRAEHLTRLRPILGLLDGKKAVIRLLDFSGDKIPPFPGAEGLRALLEAPGALVPTSAGRVTTLKLVPLRADG